MMAPAVRGHQYMMRLSNVGISFKRGVKKGVKRIPTKKRNALYKGIPLHTTLSFWSG